MMDWQDELKQSHRSASAVLDFLELELPVIKTHFPLQVTQSFLEKMNKGDPNDPLFLQIWPQSSELVEKEGFIADCLQEQSSFYNQGVVDKYASRSLVISTSACAIHCRYCFRREFPYEGSSDLVSQISKHLEDKEVREIILSGGDPFVLTESRLQRILKPVLQSKQVEIIRFHTRVPVVLPNRVTPEFLCFLQEIVQIKNLVVVLHVNHAREIDEEVASRLRLIKDLGVTLLNQAVLLHGVNDSLSALSQLSYRLLDCGVMPYYLHQLDRVRGAHHFEVSESQGQRLVEQMRETMPGYLVPRYVRESPGAASKSPITSLPQTGVCGKTGLKENSDAKINGTT